MKVDIILSQIEGETGILRGLLLENRRFRLLLIKYYRDPTDSKYRAIIDYVNNNF